MPIVIPKNEINEFSLPRICVVTGSTESVTFQKMQFQYIPKWIAIFGIAPMLYLIFFFILRKTASGTMPFSEEGWAKVKAARRNTVIAVVAFMGALVASFSIGISGHSDFIWVLPLVAIGGLIGIIVTSILARKTMPVATLIDNVSVTMKLPSAEAESAINRHLNAGARSFA